MYMLMLILLSLLAWITYVFWFRQRQDHILFPLDRRPMVLADAGLPDFQNVWTQTVDGLGLEGWHRPAAGFTKPTVLILNGRNCHPIARGALARLLADAGYGVLLAGLRGQGGNPGAASETGWLNDARAWADFLVGQGISGGRLVLYGQDTGAFLAATLASERAAAKLVLEAPVPDMASLLASRFPLLPLPGVLRHRFEMAPVLPQVQAPVLILRGADKRWIRLDQQVAAPLTVFQAEGVATAPLLEAGGGAALLAFLENGGTVAPPPTLDQEKPAGGRAVVIRR